jgi:hypothetical protein
VGDRGETIDGSVELQWRSCFGWGGNVEVKRGRGTASLIRFAAGEEGSSGRRERVGEVAAAAPGRASRGRRRPGSLIGWAHRSARDGRIGQVL